MSSPKNYQLAVLASGRGSNFRAVQEAIEAGNLPDTSISHLITDRKDTQAEVYARAKDIPVSVLDYKAFSDREAFDQALAEALGTYPSDYILALGFMRILGKEVLSRYEGRIVNIHPSLLPAFPGMNAQRQAFAYGVKISGCTVHFVDAGVDTGPIIDQMAVDIRNAKSAGEAAALILEAEHELIVRAVKGLLRGEF